MKCIEIKTDFQFSAICQSLEEVCEMTLCQSDCHNVNRKRVKHDKIVIFGPKNEFGTVFDNRVSGPTKKSWFEVKTNNNNK